MILAGLDEAGRGALAGPVVAGAVIFGEGDTSIFSDSKQLTEKERERLFEIIQLQHSWGVGIVESWDIDQIGIKKATNAAMQKALDQLSMMPDKLLVDGCDRFRFAIPSQDIIRGDILEPVISAASIVAKVMRDRIMEQYHVQFPLFKFDANKGYGTAHHLSLLEREMYSPIHRLTYEPLSTHLRQKRLFTI
jgi:ribonuclease HII